VNKQIVITPDELAGIKQVFPISRIKCDCGWVEKCQSDKAVGLACEHDSIKHGSKSTIVRNIK
jgi:hypothetical protein